MRGLCNSISARYLSRCRFSLWAQVDLDMRLARSLHSCAFSLWLECVLCSLLWMSSFLFSMKDSGAQGHCFCACLSAAQVEGDMRSERTLHSFPLLSECLHGFFATCFGHGRRTNACRALLSACRGRRADHILITCSLRRRSIIHWSVLSC